MVGLVLDATDADAAAAATAATAATALVLAFLTWKPEASLKVDEMLLLQLSKVS